jgi:hydroxyethylthiazole kinase-like sugar kinase family protein
MCIGGGAGALLGAVIAFAVKEASTETKNSVDNCATGAASAAVVFLGIAATGVAIGAIVGASSSTDDEVLTFESDLDLLKLKGHAGYIMDKERRKSINYFDIH